MTGAILPVAANSTLSMAVIQQAKPAVDFVATSTSRFLACALYFLVCLYMLSDISSRATNRVKRARAPKRDVSSFKHPP